MAGIVLACMGGYEVHDVLVVGSRNPQTLAYLTESALGKHAERV